MKKLTQEECREHELAINNGLMSDEQLFAAICEDRKARWKELMEDVEVSAEMEKWAGAMSIMHGPRVKVWANELDWLTAFMVGRYGEAEYNWPDAFGDDDLHHANQWLYKNEAPNGVTYIVAGE